MKTDFVPTFDPTEMIKIVPPAPTIEETLFDIEKTLNSLISKSKDDSESFNLRQARFHIRCHRDWIVDHPSPPPPIFIEKGTELI